MTAKNPIIIAHRGASFEAPENTLASVNLAWELGADAVEVDVQLTKENQIVVIHDFNTKRVGNKNVPVTEQTLSELQKLDVGSWKDEKWKGETIPLLRDVLSTVPANKKLIIEVKCGTEVIDELEKVVSESGLQNQHLVFISFRLDVCTAIKTRLPGYNVLLLSEMDYTWLHKIFRPSLSKLINKVQEHNLDGLDLWAGNMINYDLVRRCKQNNLLLYTWTVNSAAKAQRLIKLEVDGITTDNVKKMSALIINKS